MEKVVIIGIGLIGGSFAKGIRRLYPAAKIAGLDTNETHLDQAMALRLIDEKANGDTLSDADTILVSIPVDAMVTELPKILEQVNEDCLVIDAGSTKALVCEIRDTFFGNSKSDFDCCKLGISIIVDSPSAD